MILAGRGGVKRVLWLTFMGLALLASTVLFRSGPTGDALANVEPTPPPSVLPDVRVKHEFVTIPLPPTPSTSLAHRSESSAPAVKKRAEASSRARADVVRTANLAGKAGAPDRQDNLLIRAGRAVIGDGKYRPEPFPRIK